MVGQGALVVDFSLYLHRLNWSAVEISLVLSAALLFGRVLTMIIGPLSDRLGRRRFLLGYQAVQLLSALAALLSGAALVLGAAGILGGFRRSGNGAAGPFSPVEQAWLAQNVPAAGRTRVFSLNGAWGAVVSPALRTGGAFLGDLHWPDLGCRRPRGTAARSTPDGRKTRARDRSQDRGAQTRERADAAVGAGQHAERQRHQDDRAADFLLVRDPVRFSEGPELIGPLMAAGFLLSGAASLATGWLADRFGAVRVVVVMRSVGLAMLIALAASTDVPCRPGLCRADRVGPVGAARPFCQSRPACSRAARASLGRASWGSRHAAFRLALRMIGCYSPGQCATGARTLQTRPQTRNGRNRRDDES